jgi:hypothetical protein
MTSERAVDITLAALVGLISGAVLVLFGYLVWYATRNAYWTMAAVMLYAKLDSIQDSLKDLKRLK